MRNYNISTAQRIPMQWDIKQSGIYCILNTVNGKFYIGSSIHCYHRVKSHHFARLKSGTHTNPHLQSAYKLYGKEAFTYFIIELCSPDHLYDIEQLYLDNTNCLDQEKGYNLNHFADRFTLSPEQRRKISEAKKGKPRDPETKKKIVAALQNWKETNPDALAECNKKRAATLRAILRRDELTGRYLKNESKTN